MKTVWKFPLAIEGEQVVMMPSGAECLCVHTQDDKPQIWALVDPDMPTEPRTFFTYGTGHPCGESRARYVGTYQQQRYGLVFHVFSETP